MHVSIVGKINTLTSKNNKKKYTERENQKGLLLLITTGKRSQMNELTAPALLQMFISNTHLYHLIS